MTRNNQIEQLRAKQNTYMPSGSTSKIIAEKTLLMLVGPSCSGKSTLIKAAAEACPEVGIVSGITTRKQRNDDDPSLYRYLEHDDKTIESIFERTVHGELVQYMVHDTTGRIYASEAQDYSADINLLDTQSSNVEGLRKLPFRRAVALGVVARSTVWREWFLQRYPSASPERSKRLNEAMISIEWLINQPRDKLLLIENIPGKTKQTAQTIVKLSKNDLSDTPSQENLRVALQDLRATVDSL